MQKKIFILLILITSYFFMGNGCGIRNYYQLINYDSPTPLIYEVKKDTTKIKSYAGIDYMHSKGNYEGENINLVRLTYQTAKTKKYSLSNLSIQVFAGNYKVSGIDGMYTQDSIYDGNKFGFGGRVSFIGGVNFNIKGVRVGFGFEPSLNLDFGEYMSFRSNASKAGIIKDEGGLLKLYFNTFPYFSIPISEKTIFHLQCNVGFPGFISPIASLQFDDYAVWTAFNGERVNFGIKLNSEILKIGF
ncbi:MAG: hypothetical protein N3F03_02180 [Ignavibacteria bacterium]|nr:hypothetical protein [Ignavibacteria bacterium]